MAVPRLKDETGKRYNMLTVLERQRPIPFENLSRWVCKCDCGIETVKFGFELRGGKAKSCGCTAGQNDAPHLMRFRFPKGNKPWNYGIRRNW